MKKDAILTAINNLTSIVIELRDSVVELKEDVKILKEDVILLKEDVKVLKEDVKDLKVRVISLEVGFKDMNKKMDTISNEVFATSDGLDYLLKESDSRFSSIDKSASKKMKDYENRIIKLEEGFAN